MIEKSKTALVAVRSIIPVILVLLLLGSVGILIVPIILYFTERHSERTNLINTGPNTSALNCSEDFYYNAEFGVCYPICSQWSHYSNKNALLLLSGLVAGFDLIISSITFIIAGFRYKIICKFPTVFVLYAAITYCFGDIIFYISSLANEQLFCNSEDDLFSTLNESTTFCTISGIVHHYTILLSTHWWFAWAMVTFFDLIFPLRSRSLHIKGVYRYIHIALVSIGLIIPLISILVTSLTVPSPPYNFDDIPPTACLSRDSRIAFFTAIVPNIALTSIYSAMIIVTMRKIHKAMQRKSQSEQFRLTPAEKKLLFILILNMFFEICLFIIIALRSTLTEKVVNKFFKEYFICETFGSGEECNLVQNISFFLGLRIVLVVAAGVLPLGPLIYVINWSATKEFICHDKSNQ
ncbi:PREDICTED: uncharacterized protein LOC109580998 [Amphimedon queenslandica]|uniref:Uncharacterized protein n=2 Tax=Amphimedon queenslandica TaxID=400682 RepID=A0AAN0IZP8_AMPQE|nr:PREDICTED: uncharacterized protein LOC109580998 [Amphimedon queenslandica]|eukprot:XP_019850239.1 PREDICTED: uncharacterized protein LOC109580998 [Amphimedon queenslandica]